VDEQTPIEMTEFVLSPWLEIPQNKLLFIALLLTVWLWLLVRRRDKQTRPRVRPSPLSPDELGRMVFMAARKQNIYDYAQLFLGGSEANDLLGNDARTYLEARNQDVLKKSMGLLHQQIPSSYVYGGIEHTGNDHYSINLKPPPGGEGEIVPVAIGSVMLVGPVYRLFGPAKTASP
jgi:hypothetical protein